MIHEGPSPVPLSSEPAIETARRCTCPCRRYSRYAVAEERGISAVEQLIHFALEWGTPELRSGVLFRPIAGNRIDVEHYMRQTYTATSTDAGVALDERPGRHPRFFGSYPRKLTHYVDEGVITLPFAIRSSTSLPAQIIGLPDRGYIRAGYRADLVVIDPERIRDRATILEPERYPEGIEYVLVNGTATVDGGKRTGALRGRVLLKGVGESSSDKPDGS